MRIIGWSVCSIIQALEDISINTAQPHPNAPARTHRDGYLAMLTFLVMMKLELVHKYQ
jgi:hypothetical protein